MAPPHSAGLVPLEVTRNGQDFSDSGIPYFYYAEQGARQISPVFGPGIAAGTTVTVEGSRFVNSSLLSCRFGFVVTPAEYVSPSMLRCRTPPVSKYSGGLATAPISEYRNTYPDPRSGSVYLFPSAHYFPHYLTRLVTVEVSNNQQDFTITGINFMYYQDPELAAVYPKRAYDVSSFALFAHGRFFMNTTALSCRVGVDIFAATFITSELVMCPVSYIEPYEDRRFAASSTRAASHVFVEISNNGQDFTSSHVVFEFLGPCPTGYYCPSDMHGQRLPCPRGAFCAGEGNRNFTMCPRGTYQPQMKQGACVRCPVGYHCPHVGMHVPRLCPAGFVCDVTGIEDASQPCPEGHFCLEGTATASTTCSAPHKTGIITVSSSGATLPTTIRRRDEPPSRGQLPSKVAVGARRSGCWNNETADFGLQTSSRPSRFWSELKQLPLAPDALFTPTRGRFCLDDACMRLADQNDLSVQDPFFDYSSTQFALRRPVACPPGTYCHPGTAGNEGTMKNFSKPQPCFESMYCPEGSATPFGFGECVAGFYCPFGERIPCPAGTFCPRAGLIAPIACPPGTFNAMVSQSKCTPCPVSYICPGFNRVLPVLCPAGYVCSKEGLPSPNSLCPAGFYCLNGTGTVDPFRNDTRLRPYPCKPGTYCLKGVVSDEVRVGDYRYAQNCTEGFYCELASSSPKGSGLCPRGFTCPSGTAAPIPTDPGQFAELEGTVSAAQCAPGYYAPTIESKECIPCPPGTSCENDGTAVASICPPGSYRGSLAADGVACLACPQGTWSKNWELRGVEECVRCAPGTVCPIDGITYPCTLSDLPHVYAPLQENLSYTECLDKGSAFFFGVLLEPWIDEYGRGPHFLPSRDGRCYENHQPLGSVLYQRLADFHGPMYELANGVPHQGYGDANQLPAPNMFQRGSLVIDLDTSQMFDVARNCTPGFFHREQWFPGTCEADLICSASLIVTPSRGPSIDGSSTTDDLVSQAQPCPEGFVCDLETTAMKAFAHACPGGYVCGPGTTPDLTLDAPRGQLKTLCPASKYCPEGTAESQKERNVCPVGYFCPTGTMNPYTGAVANDGLRRRLSLEEVDPFRDMTFSKYLTDGDLRLVSAHDMRCFNGINDDLEQIFSLRKRTTDNATIIRNRAIEHDERCARDHKWRMVDLAIRRNECDCVAQAYVVQRVFWLWKCTVPPSKASPTVFDPNRFGWKEVHNSNKQCVFADASMQRVDIAAMIQVNGGVSFQTAWTESNVFPSYSKLRAFVVAAYKEQVDAIPSSRLAVDPYLYDLNHAIEMVDAFGDETPSLFGFDMSSPLMTMRTENLRLDACGCSRLFKCPNGTTSSVGSDDIYDCVKTSTEVLQRVTPIPLTHPRLVNGTDYRDLSGTGNGIGTVILQPLEVATVTINTTLLSRNITYKDHYQISVYKNCKPCPPRYACDLKQIPPGCTYPENDNTTASRLFDKCVQEKQDEDLCHSMPFFCERHFVMQDIANGSSFEKASYPGCCSCERHEMPFFFEDTKSDLGFPDNKHGYLQFSVSAIERTELTIVVELLHGLYVRDFVEGFTQDRFDMNVFTPSRADYTPLTPSMNSFFAVLDKSSYDRLMLPLNLPESRQRILGTLTYRSQVEDRIFVDRIADIMVGDPMLPKNRGFIRNTEQNSLGILVQSSSSGSSPNASTLLGASNTSAADAGKPVVPYNYFFDLYPVPDRLESVIRSDSWWSQQLNDETLIGLPYLPFFSSCRGYDSHMWIAKLLESHPDCDYVQYDQTVEVNQYPWNKKLVPNADRCRIEYTTETPQSGGKPPLVVSHQRGIGLSCTYEEILEGGAEKPRWYEAKKGTTLFYITRDPVSPNEFVADASGTAWGRSKSFKSKIGSDALVAVQGKFPGRISEADYLFINEVCVSLSVGPDAGLELVVPQEVYLNLSYYQMSPGTKRLVTAEVNFGRLCTVSRSTEILGKMAKKNIYPCAINRATQRIASSNYQLFVTWEPLDWFALMNLFQFTVDVYLGFFTLVGLLSIIQGVRCTTFSLASREQSSHKQL
ncbi:hypothetical protein PINS_up014134 [Pythium insidiosum]|nr:hypothetical protein PINS_up014134 [Pythium insidiosum]